MNLKDVSTYDIQKAVRYIEKLYDLGFDVVDTWCYGDIIAELGRRYEKKEAIKKERAARIRVCVLKGCERPAMEDRKYCAIHLGSRKGNRTVSVRLYLKNYREKQRKKGIQYENRTDRAKQYWRYRTDDV